MVNLTVFYGVQVLSTARHTVSFYTAKETKLPLAIVKLFTVRHVLISEALKSVS